MKSIEEEGVWFLPDNSGKETYGRLTFSPEESPKLYLLDQLQEIQFDGAISWSPNFDIINGYLVNGKKITLCYCHQPRRLKTGIQTSTIHAKYLIIGHHFKTLDDILLTGVSLRYKNLEEWVDLPNFEIDYRTNHENNQVKEINVKQATLEPVELGKLSDFSLILRDKPFELDKLRIASSFGNTYRKVSLEERKSIIIRAASDKKLEDIIDVIYLFQDLLTFASGQVTHPYDIQSCIVVTEKEIGIPDHVYLALMAGFIKPTRVTKSDLGFEIQEFDEEVKAIEEVKEKIVPIEIYFKAGNLEHPDTKFNFQKVLFSFKDVRDQFSELLRLWEQNSNKLESIIDLYLRLTYIPKQHINDFFLSLAQAIEAFHGLAHSGAHIDKKVYKKVIRKTLEEAVDSIPDSIPQEGEKGDLDLREYKRILKEEKLSHLNQFSLRERLEEIINEYRPCLPDNFFTSLEDQSDFLKKIRKTRNHLTHLSSIKDQHVASGQELLPLIRKLKVLLEVCLLKQLGLKDMNIKEIISKDR